MNLLTLITDKIDQLQTEEAAAKHFGVSVTKIKKWYGGTEEPPVRAAQLVLDEQIKAGKVVPLAFAPDSAVKAAQKPVETPKPTMETVVSKADLADLASGAPRALLPVTEASALVAMTPEQFELELTACLGKMPMVNRVTMIDMLRKGLDRRVQILVPTTGNANMEVIQSITALSRNLRFAGFMKKKATLIHHARNYLAEMFLKSDAEWSLWLDSDMIVPSGNPDYFNAITGAKYAKEFAGLDTLQRLTQRKDDKKIIGGVYVTRNAARKFANQLTDEALISKLRNGPFNETVPVDWVATGVVAIHRQVFEDIREHFQNLQSPGAPFSFFSMVDGETTEVGEDKLFCKRAKAAGHQSWLDCGLFAAHIGNHAFLP